MYISPLVRLSSVVTGNQRLATLLLAATDGYQLGAGGRGYMERRVPQIHLLERWMIAGNSTLFLHRDDPLTELTEPTADMTATAKPRNSAAWRTELRPPAGSAIGWMIPQQAGAR